MFIIVGVYYKYFDTNRKIVEEINSFETDNKEQLDKLENKISELEAKNNELLEKVNNNKKIENISAEKNQKKVTKIDNTIIEKDSANLKTKNINNKSKEKIKNLVKDIEYNSIDEKGNNFNL